MTYKLTIELPEQVMEFEACKGKFKWDFGAAPNEANARLLRYGVGRRFQDGANSAANQYKKAEEAAGRKNEWTEAQRKDYVDAMIKDWLAGEFKTRGAAVEIDPVGLEAIKLAESYIQDKTGCDTRKKMAAHPAAKKYVSVAPKGAITPNVAELLKFVEANDKVLGFRARAQERIKAMAAPKVDAEVKI